MAGGTRGHAVWQVFTERHRKGKRRRVCRGRGTPQQKVNVSMEGYMEEYSAAQRFKEWARAEIQGMADHAQLLEATASNDRRPSAVRPLTNAVPLLKRKGRKSRSKTLQTEAGIIPCRGGPVPRR